MSVEDRRRLLQEYTSRWDHPSPVGLLRLNDQPWGRHVSPTVRYDHLVFEEPSVIGPDVNNFRFVRLPSASLGMPTKEWDLLGIPGWFGGIHPPSNLLVVPQKTNGGS